MTEYKKGDRVEVRVDGRPLAAELSLGFRAVVAPAPQVPIFMSTDSAERKLMPVATGVMAYFPDALLLMAFVSRVGNEKHNPGQPLHWAKEKSADEPDAEARHMLDGFRELPPDPGLERLGKLGHKASKAWRAIADLQRACDEERKKFLAEQCKQGTCPPECHEHCEG
jgi:hypothetical protein